MAASKSENNSLRYHFLDNGVNNEARNIPMASADFGAESGAYFLRSTPSAPLDQYPEYHVEPDPRDDDAACPQPTRIRKKKRQKQKTLGAQVAPAAVTIPSAAEVCATVRWETLPSCMVDSVVGVTQDLTRRFQTGENRETLGSIFTKQSRLTYLLILFLLLFFVYRIFRRC